MTSHRGFSVAPVFRSLFFAFAHPGRQSKTGATLLVAFLLCGCETLPDRVAARFKEVPPTVRTFAYPEREVFHASQAAFKKLDWTLTRTVVGDGVVEAAGPINRNLALGDSRQLVARLKIEGYGDRETEVEMNLTGQVESNSGVRSIEIIGSDHSFIERYFAVLEEVLKAK
jgi:hypothetical protein